jgi:outer membrane protein assembly factor BamB
MEGYCPAHRYKSPLAGPPSGAHQLWRFPSTGYLPRQIDHEPAVGADGTIYVASEAGPLYALHPDGSVKWQYQVDGGAPGDDVFDTMPTLAADGTVRAFEVNTSRYLVIDAETGALLRASTLPGQVGLRGGVSILPNGVLYTSDNDGELLALLPDAGELWSAPVSFDTFLPVQVATGALVTINSGNRMFATNPDGGAGWNVVGFDAGGGEKLTAAYSATDGTTFRACGPLDSHWVMSFDSANGHENWRTPMGDSIGGCALADDGTTYVGWQQGMQIVASSGADAGVYPEVCGQPAIDVDGNVYAWCAGNLESIDPVTKSRRWAVPLETNPNGNTDVFGSPVIGKNGVIYVAVSYTYLTDGGAESALFAFGPP